MQVDFFDFTWKELCKGTSKLEAIQRFYDDDTDEHKTDKHLTDS